LFEKGLWKGSVLFLVLVICRLVDLRLYSLFGERVFEKGERQREQAYTHNDQRAIVKHASHSVFHFLP
jgi:hypothetical protein